jgi:hypothetical protein
MTWEPIGIDGVFFISAGTLITGFLGLCLKYILKSKCEHFNCCCGLFSIDRNVSIEKEIELKEIELEENKRDNIHSSELLHKV